MLRQNVLFICGGRTILSIAIFMSMCLSIYTNKTKSFNDTTKQVQLPENDSFELNIIEIDKYITNCGNIFEFNEFFTKKMSEQLDTGGVAPFIGRNGSTIQCAVYLTWCGLNEIYSNWRFKSLKITSNNLIFKDTYGIFGNGSTYSTYTVSSVGYVGTVKIGSVNIPTDVTKVRGDVDNLQGYSLTSAEWQSFFVS